MPDTVVGGEGIQNSKTKTKTKQRSCHPRVDIMERRDNNRQKSIKIIIMVHRVVISDMG